MKKIEKIYFLKKWILGKKLKNSGKEHRAPCGNVENPLKRTGFPQGGGHTQNLCADNNNSDHHRDGNPSQNIIRTQKVSQNNYCSKNLAFIIPEPR